MKYEVVERVAWHKYAVKSEKHGVQHWQRMDVEIRKEQVCINCKRQFAAGTVRMYKPLLDLTNRRDRLCIQCVEGVKE